MRQAPIEAKKFPEHNKCSGNFYFYVLFTILYLLFSGISHSQGGQIPCTAPYPSDLTMLLQDSYNTKHDHQDSLS